MRAVPLAFVGVLLAITAAAATPSCSFNGHDLSVIPVSKFVLPVGTENSNMDNHWKVSLCSLTPACGGDFGQAYVILAQSSVFATCPMTFTKASPMGWIEQEGGANTVYTGTNSGTGEPIVMSLTLVCDPTATTLQPDEAHVTFYQSPPNVWHYAMRLRTNATCGTPAPPTPTPTPPPTPSYPTGRCTFEGHDLAVIPSATLSIPQVVQSQPGLNLTFDWAISLCATTTTAQCGPQWRGYVVQSLPGSGPCEGVFTNYTASDWRPLYGGANAMIDGTHKTYGDRVLNVTLVCDPSAPTLRPLGAVVAHQWFDDPMVWIFDMRLATNATCGPGTL